MPKVQCPKCQNYHTDPVGLREAEIAIFSGVGFMVLSFYRPRFWFLPIIAFIVAILFYLPSLAQHYICKKCGHRWNAKKEKSGRKWEDSKTKKH